jgi:hypothetical protein
MAKRSVPASRPVAATASALAARFKDYPALQVLERRLDNPSDAGSLPLLLKDEPAPCCTNSDHAVRFTGKIVAGTTRCPTCRLPFRIWYVRWINGAEQGRWSTIKARGYVPVQIEDLPDTDAIADLFRSDKDAYVRRGDRGQEILCKIPLAYYLEFQRKKEAQRKNKMTARAVKADLAEQAGRDLGSEAGDFVHDELHVSEYKKHHTTLGDELGVDVDE